MIAIKHRVLKLLIATTVIPCLTLQNATAESCTKPPVAQGTWVSCVALGVAIAQKQSKYGLVDRRGNTVTDYQYDYIGKFQDGLAIATKEGKWGFIDSTGKRVIPLEYDNVWAFEDGFARVYKDEKMGVINKSNKLIVPIVYDSVDGFNDNLALIIKDGKVGYINQNNEVVIPLQFDIAYDFFNGKAIVGKDNKWGVINTQGVLTTPYIYEEVEPISSGSQFNIEDITFRVKENNRYGLINGSGKVLVSTEYGYFSILGITGNDIDELRSEKGFGVVNRKGIVIAPIYDYTNIIDDIVIVKLDNKYGLFDEVGNVVAPIEYDDVSLGGNLGHLNDSKFIQLEKEGRYRLFNTQSKALASELYDGMNVIDDNYIEVSIDEKYGFIDYDGKSIIDAKYERWQAYKIKNSLEIELAH